MVFPWAVHEIKAEMGDGMKIEMSTIGVSIALALSVTACGGTQPPAEAPVQSEASASVEELGTESTIETDAATEKDATATGGSTDQDKSSISANATLVDSTYHYEVEKVGSFKDAKRDVRIDGVAMLRKDGDKKYLVGTDGKDLIKESVVRTSQLTEKTIVVTVDAPMPNNQGLVSLDKGVLIPPEAAIIQEVNCEGDNPRFVEVIYGTDTTEDKAEGFFYSHEGLFSLQPVEGDVLYKGYGRVFDIEKGSFVEGVEISSPNDKIYDLGASFLVRHDGMVMLYGPDGKQLWSGEDKGGMLTVGLDSFSFRESTNFMIFDSSGTVTYEGEGGVSSLSGASGYYTYHDYATDSTKVIDKTGKTVLEVDDASYYDASDGLFAIEKDGEKSIVDESGKTVLAGTSNLKHALDGYDYSSIPTGDNYTHVLLHDGEVLLEGQDSIDSRLVISGDEGCYIIGQQRFVSTFENVMPLTTALARCRQSGSRAYGVYDLFTGEEVVSASYDDIVYVGGFVFAYADETWDVYAVELVAK